MNNRWLRAVKLIVIFIVEVSFSSSVSSFAVAGTMKDAYNAYINGKFDKALELMEPLAKNGDVEAQYILGYMYEFGHVAKQNSTEAAKWFRMAAEQGDALSQISLGRLYEAGKGVPRDYQQAAKLYKKAADQGSARGHFRLANLHRHGFGVAKDLISAYIHLKIAASGFTILPAQDQLDAVAKLLTPAELSEAERQTRGWFTAHPPNNPAKLPDETEE